MSGLPKRILLYPFQQLVTERADAIDSGSIADGQVVGGQCMMTLLAVINFRGLVEIEVFHALLGLRQREVSLQVIAKTDMQHGVQGLHAAIEVTDLLDFTGPQRPLTNQGNGGDGTLLTCIFTHMRQIGDRV